MKKGTRDKVAGWLIMGSFFAFIAWAWHEDTVNLPKRLKAGVDQRTRQFEQVVKAKFEPYLVSDGSYPNWSLDDARTWKKPKFAGKVLVWGFGGALDIESSTVINYGGLHRDFLTTQKEYSTAYRANGPEDVGTVIFIVAQDVVVDARYTDGHKSTRVSYRCCAVDGRSKEARLFTVVATDPPPEHKRALDDLDGHYSTERVLMNWIIANVQ